MCAQKDYPICKKLEQDGHKRCAALVVTKNLINNGRGPFGWPRFVQPSDELRNATITFFGSNGRVYGITSWHVVQYYRKSISQTGNPGSHSMRTMVNGFYVVIDRFIRPNPVYGNPKLDIVIRELNPEFPRKIGKEIINLDNAPVEPGEIKHAYAIGFPESLKYKRFEKNGFFYRVSMPHVSVLAEIDGFPKQRFSLFSELKKPPEHRDFSGMSGGPIFWSTGEEYGILGINYETATGSKLFGENSIQLFGELATPNIIREWIEQYHERTPTKGSK